MINSRSPSRLPVANKIGQGKDALGAFSRGGGV